MLGICDLERSARTRSRIPLSAPLEGVLDHLSTGYQLVRTCWSGLGSGAVAAEEQLWKEFRRVGWQSVDPCWGASAEP